MTTIEEQHKIDIKLLYEMLQNSYSCPKCNHLFSKAEIWYNITCNEYDNQNCPKCDYLIT